MPHKRFVFYFHKGSTLRLFLPIIRELVSSNSGTPILITCQNTENQLVLDNETKTHGSFINRCEIYTYPNFSHLQDTITLARPDVIISSDLPYFNQHSREATLSWYASKNISFYYFQYSVDIVTSLPFSLSKKALFAIHGYFTYAIFWKEAFINSVTKHHGLTSTEVKLLRDKVFCLGTPHVETLTNPDRRAICRKYGLNPNDKHLFFDPPGYVHNVPNFFYKYRFKPFDLGALSDIWWDLKHAKYQIRRFPNYLINLSRTEEKISPYPVLLSEIESFAKKWDLNIISKTRMKHTHPRFVIKRLNFNFSDVSLYPFTLHELLYISDLYVGFNSTAVMESILFRTPAVLFQIFPEQFRYLEYGNQVYQRLNDWLEKSPSWLNSPPLTRVCRWNQSSCRFLEEIRPAEIIDEEKRTDYINHYLGATGGPSSRGLIEAIVND